MLEGGEDAVALASGVAALHGVCFTFLKSGDHVVVANQTDTATYRLFADLLPAKYGITEVAGVHQAQPLRAGADLVVHSLTKYFNGHGDAMGGAVIGARDLIRRIKEDAMVDVGA